MKNPDLNLKAFVIDHLSKPPKKLGRLLEDAGVMPMIYDDPQTALDETLIHHPHLIFIHDGNPDFSIRDFMVQYSERILFEKRCVIVLTNQKLSKEETTSLLTLGVDIVADHPLEQSGLQQVIVYYETIYCTPERDYKAA